MQPRHIAVALLLLGAALIAVAMFDQSWWAESEGGTKIGFGLRGIEECREDNCESASYGPLVESEGSSDWKRHRVQGQVAFGALAAMVLASAATLLAMLARASIAAIFSWLGILSSIASIVTSLLFVFRAPDALGRFGHGPAFWMFWVGLLSAVSGMVVSMSTAPQRPQQPPPGYWPPQPPGHP